MRLYPEVLVKVRIFERSNISEREDREEGKKAQNGNTFFDSLLLDVTGVEELNDIVKIGIIQVHFSGCIRNIKKACKTNILITMGFIIWEIDNFEGKR